MIAPFNFPLALAGGPVAAALVTGNTVVLKGASDTPWAGRLLADCVRDAGVPPGVFNYLSGSGAAGRRGVGRASPSRGRDLHRLVRGRQRLVRQMASGRYPRPCIAELGGKNPCIVTAHADLDRAATGIVRSTYGMSGQKCSALSRLYVHERVAEALIVKLKQQMAAVRIGDPTKREHWLGPVINRHAYEQYARYVDALRGNGADVIAGGRQLREDGLERGSYVEPMLAEAPLEHPLWKQEMFLPILTLHRYERARRRDATRQRLHIGLTAGVFGSEEDVCGSSDHIEAGVTYVNRPGRHHRRVARATSPSVAGRAPAPPARRSPRSTTCRNTCASSRRRWSSRSMALLTLAEAIGATCVTARASRWRASPT